MSESNGIEMPKVQPNVLEVRWDPDKQVAALRFDAESFRSWGFVLAVLQMAQRQAEALGQQAAISEMQGRARAQQEIQAVKGLLKGH